MINKARPINKIRFTKEGYEKLKEEYADLLRQRPLAVMDLKTAREMGDLSENGYYKESKLKLNFIDGRLRRFSDYLKRADIVDEDGKNLPIDTVYIGSTVKLSDGKNEKTYQIVGDLEAQPSEGKLSLLSPVGKAIMGKSLNSDVEISTPAGSFKYKITKIS
ncbi:MAG TPA: transcription elongation factor GreA [Candidatus Saccharimonadales bacterium]|nr:transcription elongation factor GreA [Candidatus Saccharimonadales bacterium]